jgi:hypothetical protein
MPAKSKKQQHLDETPLVVPPGVRMAWDDHGTERTVFAHRNRPFWAGGEIPKAEKVRRAKPEPEDAPTLFGPAGSIAGGSEQRRGVVILVYAKAADREAAAKFVSHLTWRGYAAESRVEPGAQS